MLLNMQEIRIGEQGGQVTNTRDKNIIGKHHGHKRPMGKHRAKRPRKNSIARNKTKQNKTKQKDTANISRSVKNLHLPSETQAVDTHTD